MSRIQPWGPPGNDIISLINTTTILQGRELRPREDQRDTQGSPVARSRAQTQTQVSRSRPKEGRVHEAVPLRQQSGYISAGTAIGHGHGTERGSAVGADPGVARRQGRACRVQDVYRMCARRRTEPQGILVCIWRAIVPVPRDKAAEPCL